MEMVKIYPDAVRYLFGPLIGLADEGFDLDVRLRPDNSSEEIIKGIYTTELKGYYTTLDPRIQAASKLSLQYVLFAENFNYGNEFNSMLPPFECPEIPRDAYRWLWEVLFPDELPTPPTEPYQVIEKMNLRHDIFGL